MGTEKNSLILNNNWSDGLRSSGKSLNPGKPYFLDLSVKCVSEVNAMSDDGGIPLVQNAMIRCSLALNTNGRWEITQLFQDLQDISRLYPSIFPSSALFNDPREFSPEGHEIGASGENVKRQQTCLPFPIEQLCRRITALKMKLHRTEHGQNT